MRPSRTSATTGPCGACPRRQFGVTIDVTRAAHADSTRPPLPSEVVLVPLLYLPGGGFRPLTTGLYLFLGGRSIDIGPLAAGRLITIVPVIVPFIALQRQVTEGFLSGAVKG